MHKRLHCFRDFSASWLFRFLCLLGILWYGRLIDEILTVLVDRLSWLSFYILIVCGYMPLQNSKDFCNCEQLFKVLKELID